MINILSHDDFAKICHVVNFFPELNQKFGQENITFTSSSSSRAIEWIDKYIF